MFSSQDIKALLRKALAAAIAAVLGFVLLSALLIGGFVMLLEAATLALAPWVGDAGAYGITGGFCLLLLGIFFFRMFHGPASKSKSSSEGDKEEGPSPLNAFSKLITKHPWEAVLVAFALGITEQSDPRMRQMLIQSGLAFLKVGNAMDDGESDGESGMSQASNDESADAAPPS
ncbi:hypothetical protein RE428_43280 [Marinobacter nanhaiticus D15-8W]|uniref:Uncharacterized protein n=1 Tax=Marinobacter nanhaiticus D15-8W TaxID=626887 RepID=N6WXN6_9GAMM|nr:hypothetical protein [Marinobacter nanhaiticus]ENO15832.1 hypothetical protein J057_10786 [Marinobacter nanhaiticus D15-8W]BES73310.1 hypothetical protein RE428_43280 [Marinobacter nanhaiticus D15-8W]